MSLNQALIAELKQEAASTRKMLERVPTEHLGWRPHEKSMTLRSLAGHVAELTGWTAMTVHTDELDFAATAYTPPAVESTEDLLKIHDEHLEKAVAALENISEEDLNKIWTLRNGEQIFLQQPKKVVLRGMCYNHVYHHRGQLSVFLRLLNVPVPGMYGPSADEMPAAN